MSAPNYAKFADALERFTGTGLGSGAMFDGRTCESCAMGAALAACGYTFKIIEDDIGTDTLCEAPDGRAIEDSYVEFTNVFGIGYKTVYRENDRNESEDGMLETSAHRLERMRAWARGQAGAR